MDFLTWIRYGFPNTGVGDTLRHVYVIICYMQFFKFLPLREEWILECPNGKAPLYTPPFENILVLTNPTP